MATWLREEARRQREMCSDCLATSSEPPYLALEIIFPHFKFDIRNVRYLIKKQYKHQPRRHTLFLIDLTAK